VVDVLSFTTAVSVAVGNGAFVYPFPWRDESAPAFAAERGAVLAGDRSEGAISLSPVSLLGLREGDRIVLPSPNGATICAALADRGTRVIARSLRNAPVVASFINKRGWSVAVIAAGEHWRGASGMRPCFEDLIGAGAILSSLGTDRSSPEAKAAVGAYRHVADDLGAVLRGSVGGRELEAWGYAEDVTMAAVLGADASVPVLSREGYFARL
jgi:2-phosphosulfolactate phosphatase